MTRTLVSSVAVLAILAASASAQEKVFPAKLVSHAILPANTIVAAPADAADYLKTSGKFTTSDRKRTEKLGSVPGLDGVLPTGLSVPFDGQPIQGFSGIKTQADGTFWTLSDNGFGSKMNSSDAMLFVHHVSFDWQTGKVNVLENLFLSDPDKKAPFPIVMEGAAARYLTGADFDIESVQPVADGFWIGDEFGPFLLKFSLEGKLTDVFATKSGDLEVRSPDNPAFTLPNNPTLKLPAINVKRSGGYEGLAMSKDGSRLYALLEGPLFKDGEVEKVDGHPALRIFEFDTASKAFTGRYWLYPFADGGESIGDFNMIDATTGLVIERDNGAGTPDKACADSKNAKPDCFAVAAKLKRVYKIEFNDDNVGKSVRKIGYIDLLNIADPDHKRLQGGHDAVYDMPFVTIENVDQVDATHIIVGNDNNLPFSSGRTLGKADDNEFVILEVGEFLAAK